MTSSDPVNDQLDQLLRAGSGRPLPAVSMGELVDPATFESHLAGIRELARVDVLPEQARLGFVKNLVMRTSRLFLHRQASFNEQTLRLIELLNRQQVHLLQRLASVQAAVVELQLEIGDLADDARLGAKAAAQIDTALDELRGAQLDQVRRRQQALQATVSSLTAAIDDVVHDIRTMVPPGVTADSANGLEGRLERVQELRYSSFEDTYRGSQEDVADSLRHYLDDILPRRELGGPVVDIGPGRGEWLRLLRDNGIAALGVDTNAELVERCRADGLQVEHADAIEYLSRVEPASLLAVTGFHLIEHIPVGDHVRLFDAALRALRPGGLLILETPNPTNLVVGAAAFYRDPTHLRPVHPDSLTFLADETGFVGNELRFLHPRAGFGPAPTDADPLDNEVRWAILGPQDVALIARRPATEPSTA